MGLCVIFREEYPILQSEKIEGWCHCAFCLRANLYNKLEGLIVNVSLIAFVFSIRPLPAFTMLVCLKSLNFVPQNKFPTYFLVSSIINLVKCYL